MSDDLVSKMQGLQHQSPQLAIVEISVVDLHKSFGDKHVSNGISFDICRGEMVAIVGSSGSGKSTLLRHLTGHFRPDVGRVLIADHETNQSTLVDLATLSAEGMQRLERHWAVVFQQNGLMTGTVHDDMALPLRMVQGMDEPAIRNRITKVIREVGLDVESDLVLNVDQLSGGMAKRVAIASAFAGNPIISAITHGFGSNREFSDPHRARHPHTKRA